MGKELKAVVAEIKKAQALFAPIFALGDSIEKSFDAIESLESVSSDAKRDIAIAKSAVADAQAEREKAEGLHRKVKTELATANSALDASRKELAANEKRMSDLKAELARLAKL